MNPRPENLTRNEIQAYPICLAEFTSRSAKV